MDDQAPKPEVTPEEAPVDTPPATTPEPVETKSEEPTSTEAEKPKPEAPKQSRKKLFILVGVIVALIAAVGVYAMLKPDKKPTANTKNQQTKTKEFGVAVGLNEGLSQYSSDAKTWKDLTADTDLKEGDSVRTTTNGRVVLLIDDGSAVRLDVSSEVKLTSLDVNAITITNTSGEVYNRVVQSDSRVYKVAVGDETYKAKGTAYRTFNEADKKGVEVFHSTVESESAKKDIPEGSCLFSKHPQADRQGAVLALDVESLKSDSFIQWNSVQDKKVAEYADKLGVLDELDKPAPAPAPAPKAPTASSGITLSGSKSEYSAVFSWKVAGVDTSKGFKLVRSKKTTTPTYPDNTVAYIEAGKTSYTLYVGEDTTYNYRICAYRGSGCDSYSNTVAVATLKKVKETVQPGAVNLVLNGTGLTWTFQGTAPYGFKVVVGTSSGPTYENNYTKYYTESTNYELSNTSLASGTTYYIKVCKYNDGGCSDYSNEIVYTP